MTKIIQDFNSMNSLSSLGVMWLKIVTASKPAIKFSKTINTMKSKQLMITSRVENLNPNNLKNQGQMPRFLKNV